MVTLDCSSTDSARGTVARLMRISISELRESLRDDNAPDVPDDVRPFTVRWFHASRVEDPSTFLREGILPTSAIRRRLTASLRILSEGMVRRGDYPNTMSVAAKWHDRDEGPYAFLVRRAADAHHYLAAPELVQDIAGQLLGANFMQLVEAYQAMTTPCVVSFVGVGEPRHLAGALAFLHRVERGSTEVEAASSPTTCYDAAGRSVKPEEIIEIERL
jgi:hypothetical protein